VGRRLRGLGPENDGGGIRDRGLCGHTQKRTVASGIHLKTPLETHTPTEPEGQEGNWGIPLTNYEGGDGKGGNPKEIDFRAALSPILYGGKKTRGSLALKKIEGRSLKFGSKYP